MKKLFLALSSLFAIQQAEAQSTTISGNGTDPTVLNQYASNILIAQTHNTDNHEVASHKAITGADCINTLKYNGRKVASGGYYNDSVNDPAFTDSATGNTVACFTNWDPTNKYDTSNFSNRPSTVLSFSAGFTANASGAELSGLYAEILSPGSSNNYGQYANHEVHLWINGKYLAEINGVEITSAENSLNKKGPVTGNTKTTLTTRYMFYDFGKALDGIDLSNSTITADLYHWNGSVANTQGYDDVALIGHASKVPEPSSVALLGLGVAGALLRRKR